MKICGKCKIEKDENEFYKSKNKIISSCKNCVKTNTKQWKENNREKVEKYKKLNKIKIYEEKKEYRNKKRDERNNIIKELKKEIERFLNPDVEIQRLKNEIELIKKKYALMISGKDRRLQNVTDSTKGEKQWYK
jgi:predicted RNase H-like nuclease (RuvC/YqgF family)